MPRVLKRNPTWLSRPAPGFDMFTPPLDSRQSSPQTEKLACIGPRRTIAKRGTEIFVAVGNTIRWADLPTLKDDFSSAEDLNSTPSKIRGKSQSQEDSPPEGNGYRVSMVPTACYNILTSSDSQGRGCTRANTTVDHVPR